MTSTTAGSHLHPWIATIAYYLSFVLLGATTAASGPSLPRLAERTASGLDQISLIFVFGSLGYLIGSFLGGRAYDRLPGHKLMAISLLALALISALIPIAPALWLLLAAMFLSGFASGIVDVGCNTLLLWTHGNKAGPFMNGLHFFFGVGSFIAPLILARVLLQTGDILWLFWSMAIACLPVAILCWFLPQPSSHTQAQESDKASFPVLPVLLIVILFILYVGLELGFANWIYTYALSLELGDAVTSAYLTSGFWGAFTLGRLLGIWVSTRARSLTILYTDLVGCAVSAIIIMLWKESPLALWVGSLGLGLAMASIFPTILMLAGERIQVTGAITGWFLVGAGAGSMLLPWLIGQIFVQTGPQALTTVLLVDITLLTLVLLLVVGQRAVRPIEPALKAE
ncbi:MAG TPA: MFS transporter [Anaerolineales bacterium]|nr:MFS transporter [Anaerolineales bacterium]